MSPCRCVLGCAGLCLVGFCDLAQVEASNGAGLRCVLRVCWVFRRACACVFILVCLFGADFFPYAMKEKLSKPSTLSTKEGNALNLKVFSCAGFVLGLVVLCWVGFSVGECGHGDA